MLEQCSAATPDDIQNKLIEKIRSAKEIIECDKSTDVQKHNALASVVEKIVYNKKEDSISMFFYIND